MGNAILPPLSYEDTIQLNGPEIDGDLRWSSLSRLNCRKLLFHNNSLEHFPKDILNCTMIEHLEIVTNGIKTVPMGIGYLVNLTVLILDKNRIEVFPYDIGNLPRLQTLSLKTNFISSIPHKLMGFRSLEKLVLDYNPIRVVDRNAFLGLNKLKTLSMIANNNSFVPPSTIYNIPNLKTLYIAAKNLSENISTASNLKELKITTYLGDKNQLKIASAINCYVQAAESLKYCSFLPLNEHDFLNFQLCLQLNGPRLNISNIKIPENLTIIIENALFKYTNVGELQVETLDGKVHSIPEAGSVIKIHETGYHCYILDEFGSIWTIDKELYPHINLNENEPRLLSIKVNENIDDRTQSDIYTLNENHQVSIISPNLTKNIEIEDIAIGYNSKYLIDIDRKVWVIKNDEIIPFPFDLNRISKIVCTKYFDIFLDENKIVSLYTSHTVHPYWKYLHRQNLKMDSRLLNLTKTWSLPNIIDIFATPHGFYLLNEDRNVLCWGGIHNNNTIQKEIYKIPNLPPILHIAVSNITTQKFVTYFVDENWNVIQYQLTNYKPVLNYGDKNIKQFLPIAQQKSARK